MYYESQILTLEEEGDFLLAVHFPRHKIGGETDRESGHAYFAVGNINDLGSLRDITSQCTLERPPSKAEQKDCLGIAKTQKTMVGNEKAALKYQYHADLAARPARFVPRKVLTSNTSKVLLGFECNTSPSSAYAFQRLLDVSNGSIQDHKETRWPKASSVAYPLALSADGQSCICMDGSEPRKPFLKQQRISDRKRLATFEGVHPIATFVAMKDCWIAVDEGIARKFDYCDGRAKKTFSLPASILSWSAASAMESHVVSLAGDKGLVFILNTDSGEIKKYRPHRGCKRDDFAAVRVSEDSQWMATRIHSKKELVLTSLATGESWTAAYIEDQVIVEHQSGDWQSKSHIPAAFGFVGARLLAFDGDGLREVSMERPAEESRIHISEQGKPGSRAPLRVSRNSSIDDIIKQARLEAVSAQLRDRYYPACKLVSRKPKKSGWSMPDKRGAPELGQSRLGGWPDLPKGSDWPTWQGRPMSFIGQINLEELASAQPEIRLPKEGLLLFFLGCLEESYEPDHIDQESYMVDIMLGSSADHKGGWRVIHAALGAELTRTKYTADVLPELFPPCLLKVSKGGLSLPNEATAAYECMDMQPEERENFNEVLDLVSPEEPENQISGYPQLIQFTPPEIYCCLASTGRDPFSFPEQGSPEYEQLIRDASEFGMLAQFTSDENAGFMWGDVGHLYFYGKRKEMEQGDFSSCWVFYEN